MDRKAGEMQKMTEKSKNGKKPIWEPITEEDIEEGKRTYIEAIATAKAHAKEYTQRLNMASDETAPSMKAHYSILTIMYAQHADMLEDILSLGESFFDIYKQIGVALESLEKQIDEISEKTHVDLSKIKTEVKQVRKKVDAPIYKFLKEQKESEEKIRKAGENSIDNLTRSH